jgi:ribose 5-phosphate isomerase RpiB
VIRAFLAAKFSGAERHVRRLGKVNAIEADACKGVFDGVTHGRTR